MSPGRRVTAECLGTAFLLAAVVGSGIMGAALVVLIPTFGPVSGAHLNPVVTLAEAWQGPSPGARRPATWRPRRPAPSRPSASPA
jgi:glycerol uptake facilitator-like aquaporin